MRALGPIAGSAASMCGSIPLLEPCYSETWCCALVSDLDPYFVDNPTPLVAAFNPFPLLLFQCLSSFPALSLLSIHQVC